MQITKKWKQSNIALSTTHIYLLHCTKKKFSNKAFFSKCDQIQRKLGIWSHLLKLSLMENFFFLCSVIYYCKTLNFRCLREFSLDSTRRKFFDIPHSLLFTPLAFIYIFWFWGGSLLESGVYPKNLSFFQIRYYR